MKRNFGAQPYDLIGVGVGPFNLGLASLLQPIESLTSRFFEANDSFNWHAGLLLDDCTLQVPFLADLVTMVDPMSRFSYLNYLHQHGRLYQFYFYESFHVPRVDYNQYCRWVSEQMPNLLFSHRVTGVKKVGDLFQVSVQDTMNGVVTQHMARNIVLGVGTRPLIPASAQPSSVDCIHSADYLFSKEKLKQKGSITVVGGGQSAAEVFLDLLNGQHEHGYELNWLSRSNGFFPMEYSKLGLEHFSPDYIEHFHQLPEAQRNAIRDGQGHWYKGISLKTIKDIYDRLYMRSIENPARVVLQARSELEGMERTEDGFFRLLFRHLEQRQEFEVATEAVVLATGYQYIFPKCLDDLLPAIRTDSLGRPMIHRDYSMDTDDSIAGRIFVQNGEMHSHGIGAPDLGLGACRSAVIINGLLGREHYRVSNKNVFQSFGISERWRAKAADTTT